MTGDVARDEVELANRECPRTEKVGVLGDVASERVEERDN